MGRASHPPPDNPNYRLVLQCILENPARNLQELADAVGIRRTAVGYHVRRMVRAGLVVTQRQRRNILHFHVSMPRAHRTALALLRVESIRRVVLELYRDPHVQWPELAERLETTVRTVQRAIRALQGEQLLEIEKAGDPPLQTVHFHPLLRVVIARWHVDDKEDDAI